MPQKLKLKELAMPRRYYRMHNLLHNMKKLKERKQKLKKIVELRLAELKEAHELCELELKAQ